MLSIVSSVRGQEPPGVAHPVLHKELVERHAAELAKHAHRGKPAPCEPLLAMSSIVSGSM